jgi:hypothetical protein
LGGQVASKDCMIKFLQGLVLLNIQMQKVRNHFSKNFTRFRISEFKKFRALNFVVQGCFEKDSKPNIQVRLAGGKPRYVLYTTVSFLLGLWSMLLQW